MRWLSITIVILSISVGGCGADSSNRDVFAQFNNESLTEIAGSELSQFVTSSDRPVLVEFGVDVNCGRCASR